MASRRKHGGNGRQDSFLEYDHIPTPLADALRGVINRYELRTRLELPRSIAVTSAVPGEGVTTSSQALATIIAQEMDLSVCWVDCAWMNPEIAEGSTDGPDLIELLSDTSRLESAFEMLPNGPSLWTLAPRPLPDSKRNQVIRSPSFAMLVDLLAKEFDHVVFDLPPVLTNPNGLAVLRQVESTLLVVRHRATTVTQVRRALESTDPTPVLGVLLNRYRTSIPSGLRRLLGS